MSKPKFIFYVTALSMFVTNISAVDALFVHSAGDGSVQSTPLDNIQRLTFDNDDLLVKTTDGNENFHPLATVGKITFEDVISTDISTSQNTFEINLYPNPSADYIIIDSPVTISSWTLFDLNGNMLKHSINDYKIQLSDLIAGIYLLKIETANSVVTKKIIKQ